MNIIDRFAQYLRSIEILPGIESHLKLSPIANGVPSRTFKPNKNTKLSSVIILLSENENGKIQTFFTLRNKNLRHHSGQISFPGGRLDADETPLQAARRECIEEIGVVDIEIICNLTELFVPPSNTTIFPHVAICDNSASFRLNTDEVDSIFAYQLDYFLDKKNLHKQIRTIEGFQAEVPFWEVGQSEVLWGVTAMITSELSDIYCQFVKSSSFNI